MSSDIKPDTNPGNNQDHSHHSNPDATLATKPAANSDTNPFTIPIGTSDPIDLCQGLPLIPVLGTSRAGATGAARSEKLFDVGFTILVTRINASGYYSWGFGVCGPAVGFLSRNVEVLRENVGNHGQLSLTFNEGLEMQAGLFVGASVGFGLNIKMQLFLPRPWYKVWSFAWQNAFDINVGFNIDLIGILVALIQYLLSRRNSKSSFARDSLNRLRDVLPDLKQTFSMVDSAGSTNTVEEVLTATPELILPFNLVNYFSFLKVLNDRLAKVGGEISIGPSLLLQFPVNFRFTKFTVEGSLEGRSETDRADYGNIRFDGKRLSATGPVQFVPSVKPSQITSHVEYRTRFTLGVSVHFKLGLSKFFSVEVNSASLDISYLLTGVRQHVNMPPVENSVSTAVEGSCVLTPNMTLTFAPSGGGNGTNFTTGQRLRGTVRLPGFRSPKVAHVAIQIEPAVPGFPSTVPIPINGNSATFDYTFQNQCLSTGNRNNPSEVAPPSPVTPLETYTVSANLLPQDEVTNGCTDYRVQVPLNIGARFIRCQRTTSAVAGPAPVWDRLAGATINANPSFPGGGSVSDTTAFFLWFPYVSEPDVPVPVTFTLLDENRQPYSRSNVQIISLAGLPPSNLRPSATGRILISKSYGNILSQVQVAWKSRGPATGYANRFYLIVNAGCQFGQTEFWLDVWNWS